MSDAFKCAKCGSPTVKGYAADHGQGSTVYQSMWFDGEPEKRTMFGLTGDNLNVQPYEGKTICGLRCTRCGYLELYAV